MEWGNGEMSSRAKTGMGGAITGKIVVEGGGDGDGGADRTRTSTMVAVYSSGRVEREAQWEPAIAPWV